MQEKQYKREVYSNTVLLQETRKISNKNPILTLKNAICHNIDGSGDYHTTRSRSDRERQISYNITYIQNLKTHDTNELIYKTKTDSQT